MIAGGHPGEIFLTGGVAAALLDSEYERPTLAVLRGRR